MLAAIVASTIVAATACSHQQPSVVVYCSADKEFAEPVFQAYEAKTGIDVLPL